MIPFFNNHSPVSKYMIEIIDYVLKTKMLLPGKFSLQVRSSSFVNPIPGRRKNKAADLEKET